MIILIFNKVKSCKWQNLVKHGKSVYILICYGKTFSNSSKMDTNKDIFALNSNPSRNNNTNLIFLWVLYPESLHLVGLGVEVDKAAGLWPFSGGRADGVDAGRLLLVRDHARPQAFVVVITVYKSLWKKITMIMNCEYKYILLRNKKNIMIIVVMALWKL